MTANNRANYPTSFSQTGEDVFILYLIQTLGFRTFSWLDIGAHHPLYLSNTALFYEKGCRGLNVEGDPQLIQEFYAQRPQDKNLNFLASNKSGEQTFYIMNPPTLNTLSKEEAEGYVKQGYTIKGQIQIPSLTVPEIINAYNGGVFPDLLSLDAEGHDFEILQTIEWEKTAPKIICVEIAEHSPKITDNFGYMKDNEITKYLYEKDYFVVAYTGNNTIFLHNQFTR